jgi:hypothetical protein
MFRSDRDALAQQVEDMRREQAQLRAQNDAMRQDLLARRQQVPEAGGGVGVFGSVYRGGPAHLTPGERTALAHHQLRAFPVWAALTLHFLTFGIFSLIHFSLMHGRLPHAERDDPSAARALGFWFIPYLNIYWMFFSPLRLADRLNLQLRLRGLPEGIPRSLVIACAVLMMVPWVGWLVGPAILWPIAILHFQRAANTLAALPHDGAEAAAVAAREQAPGLRVAIPLVRDLPGPDAAIEQQAELEADEAARGQEARDVVR